MPSSKVPAQKQQQCPAMLLAPDASPAVTPHTAAVAAPLPVVDLIQAVMPAPANWVSPEDALQHSPPDLYLLNSTLLV
jgi:hypothetical protein